MARVRFLDQVPVGFYDVDGTGGGGLPGGPIGSIQYNDAGVLNGSANLLWNNATNTITLVGTINATSFTGSLFGTASWAVKAQTSSLAVSTISASYSTTSDNANFPLAVFNGPVLTSVGQSGSGNFIVGTSGSRALLFNPGLGILTVRSLYVESSTQLGSNQSSIQTLYGTTVVTGSLIVTGSVTSTAGFTGSLFGTSSWAVSASQAINATQALTASYIQQAVSASYASSSTSASYASSSTSASYALTASYSFNSTSASYASSSTSASYASSSTSASYASTASFVQTAQTASYVLNAISASYAATASLAPAYLPLVGGTITGDLTVNGTASITYLNVVYETASVIYSSGSNQFGDAANDVQTLYGTVVVPTGSLTVTGSIISTTGFTGSLQGTSSWAVSASQAVTASYVLNAVSASYAATASNILGGKATHVPFFVTDTSLATSSIYQSGSSTVIINQDNATSANPEALYVWQPSTTSFNVISGKGNLDNYLQLNIQNTNQGPTASSDVVATANNGNETTNYIDMGINGENYSQDFIGAANDAYLYSTGNDLHIGNATPNKLLQFFVGGTDVDIYNKLQLSPNDQHIMSGSLNASGSITAFSFTGSLFGTSSWAVSSSQAITASYVKTAQTASYVLNAISASFSTLAQTANTASYVLNAVSASQAISASYAANAGNALTSISASHALNADNALTANYATTAGNGGVTNLIAGSGITLIPPSGLGAVTIASSGGGGVTIISGSIVTGSFSNTTSFTFNHNLSTRTPIITVFDTNYNQIIPQNIQLVDTASAIITFPTPESGFAIGSTGGTTGTALSSSYAQFATYADTASYYVETDPVFVAKSASLATTGSNIFKGNQTVTGSLFTTGSNTLIGNTILTGSLSVSGSTLFVGTHTLSGSNTITGDTTLSGSIEVSGSSRFNNSSFIITGSTSISGSFNVKGTSTFSDTTFTITGSQLFSGSSNINGNQTITGSLNVVGDINVVSGSSFTRWGNKLFNYAQFANTASISATANVSASFDLPLTYFNEGININSGSRITFANSGIYNIQFSVVANQGTGVRDLHIWFKKTGSNIDNSDTLIQLQNNSQTVLAWNFMYPYSASEYVELWYHTNGANTSFPYVAAGSGFPAVPSIIVTVTQMA